MSSEYTAATELDAYWEALKQDSSVAAAPEIDAELANLTRQLAGLRALDPDAIFVEGLRTQLISGTQPTIHRSSARHKRGWAAYLAIVVLLGFLVLDGFMGRTAQAQEILRKAQAVAMQPSTTNVNSLIFTRITTYGSNTSDTPQHYTIEHVWYQAPYELRIDEQAIEVLSSGQQDIQRDSSQRTNGITAWRYDQHTKTLFVEPARFAQVKWDNDNDPNRLLQQQSACRRVELRPQQHVAGRDAYVIAFVPTCPRTADSLGEEVIWIDKEHYVVLKDTIFNADGSLWRSSEITEIAYNPAIDPAQFRFTPTPGMNIQTSVIPATTNEQFWGSLNELAGQAPFPLFVPQPLPEGFIPREPVLTERLILVFALPEKATANQPPAQRTVTIYERAATSNDSQRWHSPHSEAIQINGVVAYYEPGRMLPDGSVSNRNLSMVRGGVAIDIASNVLSRDEFVALASALRLFP